MDGWMDGTSTSIFASSISPLLLSLLSLKYMGSNEDEHNSASEMRWQCRPAATRGFHESSIFDYTKSTPFASSNIDIIDRVEHISLSSLYPNVLSLIHFLYKSLWGISYALSASATQSPL